MIALLLAIATATAWEITSDADRMTDVGNHYAVASTDRGALIILSCSTERPEASLSLSMPRGTIVDAQWVGGTRRVAVRYRGTGEAVAASGLFVGKGLTIVVDDERALLSLAMVSPSSTALLEIPTYRLGSVVHELDTSGIVKATSTIEAKCRG